MTRENPLTHHEKLRYDYLLKNIHYLNDKEKREFAFLQAKLDGQKNVRPVVTEDAEEVAHQEFTESNTGLPSYTNRSRASRRTGQPQPKTKLPKQKKPKKKEFFESNVFSHG
ncbi:psr family protein [Streptococcus infantis SK970]|nr:psr family protein [Streptococcus infantis SK970]